MRETYHTVPIVTSQAQVGAVVCGIARNLQEVVYSTRLLFHFLDTLLFIVSDAWPPYYTVYIGNIVFD